MVSCDSSRAALAKYEKNARQPDFETVKRIAKFFNVSIDYLLGTNDGVMMIDIKELLKDKKKRVTWGNEELDHQKRELLKAVFGAIHDHLKNKKS